MTGTNGGERPPRVLHIAAPGPVGGLESVVLGLASGQRDRGLGVEVVAVVGPDPAVLSSFVEPLREANVVVHSLPLEPRAYWRERREVRAILAARRPDVVHTHGYRVDVLDSGVARALGIPTVTTVHGSSRMSWKTYLYEKIQFRLLRRFDVVIAVSRDLVPDLRRSGVPEERIRVVPNAWAGRGEPLSRADARRALGLAEEPFVLGWVGRLIPVKGPDLFLEAVRLIHARGFVASIIGDGPERDSLERLAKEAGLESSVRFHGRIEGAGRLFSAFDAFVLSSRSEGSPMVLFEAMAAGVPIIAARVGGVADIVSESEARLVTPRVPAELAAALSEAISGRAPLARRAAAARERLQREFSTETWLARHEELYREVIGRQGNLGNR